MLFIWKDLDHVYQSRAFEGVAIVIVGALAIEHFTKNTKKKHIIYCTTEECLPSKVNVKLTTIG